MDQNYDYHFIIKELAEEFRKQFTCLRENTEKYITFTVPIEKKVMRIEKNGEEIIKNISYILQFVESARFMARSVLNLVNNISEGIHRMKYKHYNCFLEYTNFKGNLIEYKCLCCNKNYQHKFDEKLKERFFNKYKFSNHDKNKFILVLQKGVYPYEYMDDLEKFSETSLSEKEDFYRHLNMEDITDTDYAHAKRVCNNFEIKNLGKCHDLYVQSNTLMLDDVFENFRNICLKIYKLDPAKFLSASGSAW